MDRLHRQFRQPAREFSPVATWWWSAARLDLDRLRWQLRQMVDHGLHNVLVISLGPAGPHMGTPMDDPRTFSDAWWEIFVGVCAEARRLGARLWMYDQIGFSSANVQEHLIQSHPSFEGRRLERYVTRVNGPGPVHGPANASVLTAVAYPDGRPPQSLVVDGATTRWEGPGPARVCVFYTVTRGFDYYNPAACRALLDVIHGELERRAGDYLGDVVVGTFQDELDRMPSWSPTFADEFTSQHGYDLVPRLAALWEGDSAADRRARVHYHRTRTALAEKAFFRPFFDWHDERGLICGFDQKYPARAGDPLATVQYYGDYFVTNRWYGAPGSDHGGETKVHSSIAHVNKRQRVWLEAFHSTGWGGTLEETFDWLIPRLRSGATLYNPHAVYYSTQQGWWEWAPPSTCWRQPYWRHYRWFADAVSRLCAVLSAGRHRCDVALLYPTTTMQAGATRDRPTPAAERAREAYDRMVGRLDMVRSRTVVGVLDGANRDFDVIDDHAVATAVSGPNGLGVGEEEYPIVVLPACTVLPEATARGLVDFVRAGGVLIAIATVPSETVEPEGEVTLRALQELFSTGRARQVAVPEEIPVVLADTRPRVEAEVPTLLREVDGRAVLFVPAVHPWATRLKPVSHRRDWEYDFDPDRYRRETEVFVRGVAGPPQQWDVLTGAARSVRCRAERDGVRVWIPFDSGPAALLVWPIPAIDGDPSSDPQPADGHEPFRERHTGTVPIEGPWACDLVPTVDTTLGDDPPRVEDPDLPVQTWHVDHAVAAAHGAPDNGWRRVKATYGPYAWRYGPVPRRQLPAPGSLGPEGPAEPGWVEVRYSLTYGLAGDPIHQPSFGLKGGVPDEFCHFGAVREGEGVQLRTSVWSDADEDLWLAVGCPAAKHAWVNGQSIGCCDDRELWIIPVQLRPGNNIVDLRFVAEKERELRAYWTLLDQDPQAFARPEWMRAADPPVKDSLVTFTSTLTVPSGDADFELQVAVDTASASYVWIDDRLVGRQSGRCRIERYDEHLSAGRHRLRVEVLDPGPDDVEYAAVLVDAVVHGDGQPKQTLLSDATWRVRRDGGPDSSVVLRRHTWWPARSDPSLCYLHRRPHPLPEARARASSTPVAPFVPDALPGSESVELLRWTVPPGATSMKLPIEGSASLTVDGVAVPVGPGWMPIPRGAGEPATAVLRVLPKRGRHAGALLSGPIEYHVGQGMIEPGDWADAGLDSYSGGVRYRRTVDVETTVQDDRWLLDLGTVRGTAEVWWNGQHAGVRVWSPYRLDVTDLVHRGHNTVEILVFNTLAPILSGMTDTPYVFPGQNRSGLLGPVRLVRRRAEGSSPDVAGAAIGTTRVRQ